MKCQFINNDDFFEDYILERLDEAEKQAFKGHLSECKVCSKKLAQQEKILIGIREVGRAEMKAEIKNQAELASSEKFNWSAVTRIAALAFIFILTPTMYYVYKNQVQPESAPLAAQESLSELMTAESDFADELGSLPVEKEVSEETKKNRPTTASNILGKSENQLRLNSPKSNQQAPQLKLRKRISKEDSRTEQTAIQSLDNKAGIDMHSLEEAESDATDDDLSFVLENEVLPVSLGSMPRDDRLEDRDSKIEINSFLEKKDESTIFSKIISLNDREVGFQLVIEPHIQTGIESKWPDEFPISVTRPDSNRIVLKGELPAQIISKDDFSARGISKNEIEIQFGEKTIYRIRIDRAASKAIRID